MTKKFFSRLRKATACVIVLIMLFQTIAVSGLTEIFNEDLNDNFNEDLNENFVENLNDTFNENTIEDFTWDEPWGELPEIAPFEVFDEHAQYFSPAAFTEFDQEFAYLHAFEYLHTNELSELPPEALEELLRTQELYRYQHCEFRKRERESAEFLTLIRQGLTFSQLTEENRHLIFNQLEIENTHEAAQSLAMMEHDGFSLYQSVKILWIMSTGLFTFNEAQILIERMPSLYVLLPELAQFEHIAQGFNLNAARQMFLNNHSTAEISATLALGAALRVAPETFLLPPGTYYSALNMQVFGHTSPSALSVRIDTVDTVDTAQNFPAQPFEFDAFQLMPYDAPPPITPIVTHQPLIPSLPSAMQYPFNLEKVLREFHVNYDELDELIVSGMEITGMISPLAASGATHENIVSSPFNLHFNESESVNLNTGAAMYRVNVLSLPGRGGFGLNLDLVYDSSRADYLRFNPQTNRMERGDHRNGLGVGWRFDLPDIHDSILYVPGRGDFPIDGNRFTDFRPPDMLLFSDTTFASGSTRSARRLTFHNGTSYFFSSVGDILGMVDRHGNTIRFEYRNESSLGPRMVLHRIIDTNGSEINFQHAPSGFMHRALTVTSPDGGTFVIYMHRRHQISTIYTIANVRNQVGAVTTFLYDFFARNNINTSSKNLALSSTNSTETLLLFGVRYPSGAYLIFDYRQHTVNFGRFGSRHIFRVASRSLYQYSASNVLQRYNETTFTYQGDATAFPQQVDLPPANHTYGVTVTQNNGMRTVYTFNNLHLNTSARTYNHSNVLLSEQTTTYNANRLPTGITLVEHRGNNVRPTVQSFAYNNYGQILTSVNPLALGNPNIRYRTIYTYDNRFGLPLTRTFMPDANTTVVERNLLSTDGRNITRTNTYENNVRVARTDFLHDTHGNVTRIREFSNVAQETFISTYITFDRGTLPSSIRTTNVRDANNSLVAGTGIVERRFTYDAMWRTLSETDPNGYITRWQYDRTGRITRIDFPNGGFVTYAYDDRASRVTHRTVLGAIYTYQYNALGLLASITVDGTVIRRNYYDNRMRLTDTFNASGANSSSRTNFSHDMFDRVTRAVYLNSNLSITGWVDTVYEDATATMGSTVRRTIRSRGSPSGTGENPNAPSIVTVTRYDRVGRMVEEGVVGGKTITYTYDLAGRLIREQSLGVDNTFTHNIFGVTSVRNIEGHTSRNVYDGMGRLTRSSDFMGNYTLFAHDALGRVIQRSTPFERRDRAILTSATRYFYDRGGNLIQTAMQIGIPWQASEWATTDNTFRHNMLISSQAGGTGGIRTDYTYDLAGNILTKTVGAAVTTFTYNNRGQLTQTTDALGQRETFTYDANGNMLTKTDRNGTLFRMTYNSMGQLTRQEAVQNGVVVGFREYTYTLTGALRNKTNGIHIITMYYNAQGLLSRQVETDGIVKTFTYNAAGNRTSSRIYVNNALHINNTYAYDAAQRLQSVTSNGERLSRYTYDANGRRIRTTLDNGITTDYTRNLAGIITNVTNRRGTAIRSSFDYLHYLDGNVRQVTDLTVQTSNYGKSSATTER